MMKTATASTMHMIWCWAHAAISKVSPIMAAVIMPGGYPDDGYGVCTDVVWHAFAQAGYPLKELVDADVAAHAKEYGIAQPDGNIDFRRVSVLQVFFQRHARSLPTEDKTPSLWQPGDIVIYKEHIGICSDLRNAQGVPLLLHFDAFGARERDELWEQTVIAHYRWE